MNLKSTALQLLLFAAAALTGGNAQTTVNVAPLASAVTASYTAAWNNLNAINNNTVGYGPAGGGAPVLGNTETWGAWSASRPASQWLQYDWATAYTLNRATVYFWADNAALTGANSGVALPAAWRVQYWDAVTAAWADVLPVDGQAYTRNTALPNTVEFNSVTTTKLRLCLDAQCDAVPAYAALGVTEWQVDAVVAEPVISVDASRIILSEVRGRSVATLNVKGINIPSDGIAVSSVNAPAGVGVSTARIAQAEALSSNGFNITVTFSPEQGQTAYGTIDLTAGGVTRSVSLVTSKDNGCFAESKYNLVYDPRFLTMDRLTTWGTAPAIVTVADGEAVKCGASCLKFTGTSGIEMRNNVYFGASTYKISGWIKSNGTFETGVYGTGAGFSTAESAVIDQSANSVNFLIPDTKGEWAFFEYTFAVKNPVLGGAWVNNDRNRTATLVYLDNWQIVDAGDTLSTGTALSASDYPIRPVSFTNVKFTDAFWAPRIKRNQDVTIPIALAQCYTTGRVDNFKKAGGLMTGYFATENTFDDTDIYKILEGMSYSVQSYPNPVLEAQMDTLIDYIGKAQEADGYLYTARTAGQPGNLHAWVGAQRWEKDPDLSHELYNCGHLYEAAVAHYQATGKRSLLDIAVKNADLLVHDFLVGGLTYEPGHQIVEMGLVKMYRATGKKEYLDLAKYFLDLRGTKGVARKEYSQSHLPVTKQAEAVGHAVRAVYMYSGMADVAALTGDGSYLNAVDTIWHDVVDQKCYVTGGIGARHDGEAFGLDYELPDLTAYNETCAAIGHVYWNHRMFLMHGDARYYDMIERALYNGVISGISLSGDHFFYPNPLQSDGRYLFNHGSNTRQEWFGCACCPSNLCRFTASIPGYVYAQKADTIYVNLYVQGHSSIKLDGNTIQLSQVTNYPWEGNVVIDVNPETTGKFSLLLRVPGWALNRPVPGGLYGYLNAKSNDIVVKVNGNAVGCTVDEKGYIVLANTWQAGDRVEIGFPMDVHRTVANANVADDAGKVSLERGPIVYALEWPDNNGHVLNSVIGDNDSIVATYQPDKLTGMVGLRIAGKAASTNSQTKTVALQNKQLTAIPYYAWDNRGVGEMAVWVARTLAYAKATPQTDTLVYNVTVKPDYGTNNTNYPYTLVPVDKQPVADALGLQPSEVQTLLGTTVVYAALNPAGFLNTTSTAGTLGHWFDNNGTAVKWNAGSYVFSELDAANLTFKIGLYPGLSKVGDSYTVMQALTYTPDSTASRVVFKFNVTVSDRASTGVLAGATPETVRIYTSGQQLFINDLPSGSNVTVHDLLGKKLVDARTRSTSYHVALPLGEYIVSAGNLNRKIVVR